MALFAVNNLSRKRRNCHYASATGTKGIAIFFMREAAAPEQLLSKCCCCTMQQLLESEEDLTSPGALSRASLPRESDGACACVCRAQRAAKRLPSSTSSAPAASSREIGRRVNHLRDCDESRLTHRACRTGGGCSERCFRDFHLNLASEERSNNLNLAWPDPARRRTRVELAT